MKKLNVACGLLLGWTLFFHSVGIFWPNWHGYCFYYTSFNCLQGVYHYSAFYIMIAVTAGVIITVFLAKKFRILLSFLGIALSSYTLIPVIIRPRVYCSDSYNHAYPFVSLFGGKVGISEISIILVVLLFVISTTLTVMQLFKNKHDPIKT